MVMKLVHGLLTRVMSIQTVSNNTCFGTPDRHDRLSNRVRTVDKTFRITQGGLNISIGMKVGDIVIFIHAVSVQHISQIWCWL